MTNGPEPTLFRRQPPSSCHVCLGMILVHPHATLFRKEALGPWRMNRTVRASGVSMLLIFDQSSLRALTYLPGGFRMTSNVNFTSSDVSGLPSDHVSPLRSRNSTVSPPSATFQVSARS